MTIVLTDLLRQLAAPGTFAARQRAPAKALDLEVIGLGPLELPIAPRTAQKLRALASPSPFGLRERTLHDPAVRTSLEIPSARLRLGERFGEAVGERVRSLTTELGFPEDCELEVKLDKLLLYEKGHFFKTHQDSEKSDGMIATLVVVLPSEYAGGAITVEHRGETRVFRRQASQKSELSLLAFYADCQHSVSAITSGVRVALTFQLSLTGQGQRASPVRTEALEPLVAAIREHFARPVQRRYGGEEPPPERLIYLLDHEYTQRGLSWSRLKNGDRVRVAALRSAAERLDCECFLALAEVHETWMCDDDTYGRYGGRWGRRRYWDRAENDDESVEAAEHQLIELQDSSVELSHWLDHSGKPVEGSDAFAGGSELVFTTPSSDLAPFKSEHEGYQGNYGNTVDRWYHRAAFVMWPKANTFSLRAQASPEWALNELTRDEPAVLQARVSSLLPHWRTTAGRLTKPASFAKVLEIATRLADSASASAWLSPLRLQKISTGPMRRRLAQLVEDHGAQWAKELVASWTKEHRGWAQPEWAPTLAALCEELHARKSEACEALVSWLLAQEIAAALERCQSATTRRQPWLELDGFRDETGHLAHVLAAAAAAGSPTIVEGALTSLHEKNHTLPLAFVVRLVQACAERSSGLRARVLGSALHRTAVERLQLTLQAPERREDDWTLDYELGCKCADCQVLARFLQSSRQQEDWPLSKERRRHIHGQLESAKLPISHATLRVGRPQVLQLRKKALLFSRERSHRATLAAWLEELSALA